MAYVSPHPDLRVEREPGGRVHEALSRDTRLRVLLEQGLAAGNGNYALTPEIFSCFQRVMFKTVQGLFFGLYDRVVRAEELKLDVVDDRGSVTPEQIADRYRPSPLEEIGNKPLSDITPSSWHSRQPIMTLELAPPAGGAPIAHSQLKLSDCCEWGVSDLAGHFRKTFLPSVPMTPSTPSPAAKLLPEESAILLRTVQVHLLDTSELRERAHRLLSAHHYLGGVQAVGEPLHYAVSDAQGEWVAVLIFAAAAQHLRPRDKWIGWSDEQRRRRLALVVNNVRFLLLPERTVHNLGSVVLSRILARLSDDWQARYGHPVLVVETFVDPERFQGSVYSASGWTELGLTKGHGRTSRDYYENHDRPKRLFARELVKNALRSLQAEHLKAALAAVEARVPVRSTLKAAELKSLSDHFRGVPEYRRRMGQYPLFALLGITACAYLAGCPRGQKDLAAFARRLSGRQRAALGVRRNAADEYPAPSQPTLSRMFEHVSEAHIEAALLAHQAQVRGAPPEGEIVVLDGKVPKHSGGLNVVTAVTVPGLHYLGSEVVAEKTNEIPAVRALCERLELDGRLVSIDAMHTQTETARQIVLAHGGDYLMTLKANQPAVQTVVQAHVPDPGAPLLFR